MVSILVVLPGDFELEKQALACLVEAGMLTQIDVQFEYPGDDDAPDGNT